MNNILIYTERDREKKIKKNYVVFCLFVCFSSSYKLESIIIIIVKLFEF